MLKFIIRLDDACPNMNKDKWDRIESILDKYNVTPIVGVIPDNKDAEFVNPIINNFWENYPIRWQKKGWIIAQHGLNHNLSKSVRTEFSGKTLKEQKDVLKKGYSILLDKGVKPTCFFAPAHTFDNNTVLACKELGFYDFISDGYSFFPYKKNGMMFLPCVFDTPHVISKFGVFTFVYHPNNTTEEGFEYLEEFLKMNINHFDNDINKIILNFSNRKKNIFDYMLQFAIFIFRKLRGKNE